MVEPGDSAGRERTPSQRYADRAHRTANEEGFPMGLFALLAGVFPRTAFAVYWIARPSVVDAVCGSFIWPLLGLIFLPFTTLMHTIRWTPGTGISGWDWPWVGIAVMLDRGHYGASAHGNRDKTPGTSYGANP
jgi:hypothetical protein